MTFSTTSHGIDGKKLSKATHDTRGLLVVHRPSGWQLCGFANILNSWKGLSQVNKAALASNSLSVSFSPRLVTSCDRHARQLSSAEGLLGWGNVAKLLHVHLPSVALVKDLEGLQLRSAVACSDKHGDGSASAVCLRECPCLHPEQTTTTCD